jgi:hypothetical protein
MEILNANRLPNMQSDYMELVNDVPEQTVAFQDSESVRKY